MCALVLAAVALKSGDGKEDDVAGAQTRSKYKSEKSFKKEKSSKSGKDTYGLHFLSFSYFR